MNMRIDKDIYIKGFRLTFENAKRLFNAAKILETKSEFAIANSLLVLSAEEGIKAYIAFIQHLFPEKKHDNFDIFFKDHKHKLKTIRSITVFSQIFKEYIELYIHPIIENTINSKEDIQEFKKKSFQNFLDWLKHEAEAGGTDLSKQNNWWKHATTMKENGFYVSFNNGHWKTPRATKKEQYLKTKKYVREFLEPIEVLNKLDKNNELDIEMISKIKDMGQREI